MSDKQIPASPTKASLKDRIAKVMARAGVASRRDCEKIILAGRVSVNGKKLTTPAFTVTPSDTIIVDGEPLADKEPPRLWRYHKPAGLTTTHKDEQGRDTVFANLPKDLPRVISVGRLDINSEGLLLLTNDGSLTRALELPSTAWVRRYRARAYGEVTQEELDVLKAGITIDGHRTGPVEAVLDKQQGDNVWISVSISEGKNREVRRALETVGLQVNRLIRISYGPFQLSNLERGGVEEVKNRVLRDQVGHLVEIPKARTAPGKTSRHKGPNKAKSAAKAEAGVGKAAPKGRGKFAKSSVKSNAKSGGKPGSKAKRPSRPKATGGMGKNPSKPAPRGRSSGRPSTRNSSSKGGGKR